MGQLLCMDWGSMGWGFDGVGVRWDGGSMATPSMAGGGQRTPGHRRGSCFAWGPLPVHCLQCNPPQPPRWPCIRCLPSGGKGCTGCGGPCPFLHPEGMHGLWGPLPLLASRRDARVVGAPAPLLHPEGMHGQGFVGHPRPSRGLWGPLPLSCIPKGCTARGSLATPGHRGGGHRTPIPSSPRPNEPVQRFAEPL